MTAPETPRVTLARATRRVILVAIATGFVVFNVFFSVLVSRGEKQYFWDQARHELGLAPRPSLKDRMARTVDDAVWKAGLLAILVAASGVGGALYVSAAARRE